MKYLTRPIWIISLVSLFTDVASEMLYPVMPVYLKTIGFSVALIGVLEGIAEAVAGFSKGYFGELSDSTGKRLPFVRFGYALSALSKPMLAAFTNPAWIFSSRTLDRLGKGVRTAARDALLSDETNPGNKGKVFGFHRGMDTLGAVIGPLTALAFLYYFPGEYRSLFLWAFIPGMLAILLTFFIRDKRTPVPREKKKVTFISFLKYFKEGPPSYRKLVYGLLAFGLFNSSDVFLLLKVKEAGVDDSMVILIYTFYNLVYAIAAWPAGILADKVGMKLTFISGLFFFAVTYAGMSMANELWQFFMLFAAYGIFAAATEGISKAWITNLTDKADTATAIGTYTAFNSICALVASILAGIVWNIWGPATTFLLSGITAALVALYLMKVKFVQSRTI